MSINASFHNPLSPTNENSSSFEMTMFNYAQSKSLLKGEVNEKDDGESHSNRIKAKDSVHQPADSSGGLAIPRSDTAKSISTSNAKEKIIPTKKSKHTKHNLATGATATNQTTKNTEATISQQKGSEQKTGAQDPKTNTDATAKTSTAKTITEKKPKRIRKPRRIIPDKKEFIPLNEQPTQSDIVGGRGGRSNHHPGNRPYWIRILESRLEYTTSRSDNEKARIANGILRYVKEELKGRFLNIDSKTNRWYILPDAVVLDKIKQALRDKYIPYWARELNIENKKHNAGNSGSVGKDGAFWQQLSDVTTTAPRTSLNPMSAFGSSFGMKSPNMMDQAVQLAAIKASRSNAANSFGLSGAAAAKVGAHTGFPANPTALKNSNSNNTKDGNKLGFLFGASAKRTLGTTAAIPTVDDILKCKVDQMPSFGGVPNAGLMAAAMAGVSAPRFPSIGMNPFQSHLPRSLVNSLGFQGLPGPNAFLNEAAHRGLGVGGNPGAPYGMGTNLPPSIGVLQGINMNSLDKYMEEKMTAQSLGTSAFGTNAANLPSLNMMSALNGNTFDKSTTHSPVPAALPSATKSPANGPKKTDWNAMFASALTKSK